jgi:hypothetical protein
MHRLQAVAGRVRRLGVLHVIGFLAAVVTFTGFAMSYGAEYGWAGAHQSDAPWAWPMVIDVFPAAGELWLFGLRQLGRAQWPAWLLTTAGWGLSVAINAGRVSGHAWTDRATNAAPPAAAAAAIAAGLLLYNGLRKDRVKGSTAQIAAAAPQAAPIPLAGAGTPAAPSQTVRAGTTELRVPPIPPATASPPDRPRSGRRVTPIPPEALATLRGAIADGTLRARDGELSVRHAGELAGLSRHRASRALRILAAESSAVTLVAAPNGHHTPPLQESSHGTTSL